MFFTFSKLLKGGSSARNATDGESTTRLSQNTARTRIRTTRAFSTGKCATDATIDNQQMGTGEDCDAAERIRSRRASSPLRAPLHSFCMPAGLRPWPGGLSGSPRGEADRPRASRCGRPLLKPRGLRRQRVPRLPCRREFRVADRAPRLDGRIQPFS